MRDLGMKRSSEAGRVRHRRVDWVLFLCPLLPFLVVSLIGQPVYLGAGIATAFMAGIGYRITGSALMLRQLWAVVMLVLAAVLGLTFGVPHAGPLAVPLAAAIPFVAAAGVGISFGIVVKLFGTTPPKGTSRTSAQVQA
ncbi:hypothetical protein GCM10028794_27980 [Silanimonas algicola]